MAFGNGEYHHQITMTAKLTIDKAGRVVIPKPVREQLHLVPGDTLALDAEGECITLQAVRPKAMLTKEHGIWVYHGDKTDASISELIEREREKRLGGLRHR
jgi:AbrB family looped-hinge helix DNA binding protein